MLYKEYEDADELIRMLQMRSPEVDNEGYASGGNKGFDDIYLIYERQKVNYQKEDPSKYASDYGFDRSYKTCLFILSTIAPKRAVRIKSNLH